MTAYFDVALGLGGCNTKRRSESVLRPLTEQEKERIDLALSEEGPNVRTVAEQNLYGFEG